MILFYGLEQGLEATSRLSYNAYAHTHMVGTPLVTQQTIASTYATSTVALLNQ